MQLQNAARQGHAVQLHKPHGFASPTALGSWQTGRHKPLRLAAAHATSHNATSTISSTATGRLQGCEPPCKPTSLLRSQLMRSWMALCASTLAAVATRPCQARSTIVSVLNGKEGERNVVTTASGIKYADEAVGKGPAPKTGDLVMAEVVGSLEDGRVFLDTRAAGQPLAFQLGTTTSTVPEGLAEAVEGMHAGGSRLAVVPASLGYGTRGVRALAGGAAPVPPGAALYFELELLRCQEVPGAGLACCPDARYPCLDDGTVARLQAMAAMMGGGAGGGS